MEGDKNNSNGDKEIYCEKGYVIEHYKSFDNQRNSGKLQELKEKEFNFTENYLCVEEETRNKEAKGLFKI